MKKHFQKCWEITLGLSDLEMTVKEHYGQRKHARGGEFSVGGRG